MGFTIYDFARRDGHRDAMEHGLERIGHGFLRLAALLCHRLREFTQILFAPCGAILLRIYTDSKVGRSFKPLVPSHREKSVSNPW